MVKRIAIRKLNIARLSARISDARSEQRVKFAPPIILEVCSHLAGRLIPEQMNDI